ncbi:hypothetical protein LT679_00475 [Mucilaginibacter roseus]|uniref:DUF4433 domain-containing protein n=1 Tax=Mucilaginibacter roseus TaxID=1528868 RepID=A0ABS8TW09_9SPHI|nr:hypothetical protein [Mucilaginibacter roseus]MCD8739060.1 hypothetical protein [Mucilaginibacter roseus]
MMFRDQVYKTFLAENRPFYHITPTSCVTEILSLGLHKRNLFGICCTIVNDEIIMRHIIDTQLQTTDEIDFTIIKIEPEKFGLVLGEIARDKTLESTNLMHLNIIRESLPVTSDDIVGSIKVEKEKIPDEETVIQRTKKLQYDINVSVL